jgi:D-arginine dehydrogenase
VHHIETATTLRVRRVAKSWAGMRSFTRDRLPAIGFDRSHSRFFWLAGQGGFGILSSPALGALAAALLTEAGCPEVFGEHELDPAVFSPGRF